MAKKKAKFLQKGMDDYGIDFGDCGLDACEEKPEEVRRSRKSTTKRKYSLVFNPFMGAYGLNYESKEYRKIYTADEYVEACNTGELSRESEDVTFWTDRTIGDKVVVVFRKTIKNSDSFKNRKISNGMFRTIMDDHCNIYLQPFDIIKDKYYSLSDMDKDISKDIKFFLSNRKKYQQMSLKHQRGLLLYGPAGCGKTMLVEHVADIHKKDLRIIFVSSMGHLAGLMTPEFYSALKDKPIIIVLEEIVAFASSHGSIDDGSVSRLLSFIDGEYSWDNILMIATTNYPERLPYNLIDRPSRFDKLYQITYPDTKTRRLYLSKLLKNKNVDESIVRKTEGLSLAYLKELIISYKIYGRSFNDILKEFNRRKHLIRRNFDDNQQAIGFSTADEIREEQKKRSIGFASGEGSGGESDNKD